MNILDASRHLNEPHGGCFLTSWDKNYLEEKKSKRAAKCRQLTRPHKRRSAYGRSRTPSESLSKGPGERRTSACSQMCNSLSNRGYSHPCYRVFHTRRCPVPNDTINLAPSKKTTFVQARDFLTFSRTERGLTWCPIMD